MLTRYSVVKKLSNKHSGNVVFRLVRLITLCHFYLHMSHKAAKSMAKLISQSCGDSQSAMLAKGPFKGYPSTRGCQTGLRKGLSESTEREYQQ